MIKVNAHILNYLSSDANINVIATLEDVCCPLHKSSNVAMTFMFNSASNDE